MTHWEAESQDCGNTGCWRVDVPAQSDWSSRAWNSGPDTGSLLQAQLLGWRSSGRLFPSSAGTPERRVSAGKLPWVLQVSNRSTPLSGCQHEFSLFGAEREAPSDRGQKWQTEMALMCFLQLNPKTWRPFHLIAVLGGLFHPSAPQSLHPPWGMLVVSHPMAG